MRRADRGLVRMAVRNVFAYRAYILTTLVTLIVQLFLLRKV